MKTVQFIVTGKCEELALHSSFRTVFPELQFNRPTRCQPMTSSSYLPPLASGVRSVIDKFARSLVGAVDEYEGLVVGVDDLEIENEGKEHLIATEVAHAVNRAISEMFQGPKVARMQKAVRERCSFHLLIPMVEAYFFGDLSALACANLVQVNKFDPVACDVEAFEVDDDRFLQPEDTDDKDDWCRGGRERRKHPKRYLKFLTGNGAPGNFLYRETKGGKVVLERIDWRRVTERSHFTRSARALLTDLSDFCMHGFENRPDTQTLRNRPYPRRH